MPKSITLPNPQKDLKFPLMKALEKRKSTRKWKNDPISEQDISNLLWVACGINREKKGKRTAPSSSNWQEISIYVALNKGLFRYNEKEHKLTHIISKDIRKNIGTQKIMHSAPVGFIYVSDYSKMKGPIAKNNEIRWFCSAADTGFISQNVYLYCAAANLSTVVLGLVNREKLQKIMGLKDHEKVVLTQVVGYINDE